MTLTDADLARLEEHTPGPLRAESDEEQWWSVIDSESFTIADLIGSEADARLFAAGPDLVAELREARAEIERLRAKLGRFEAMLPLDGSVYPLTTDDIRRVLADDTGKYVVVPVVDLSIVPADAELREARAALARVKALCGQAVAEYEPHDVTPWVAVHELRAAMAGES